MVSPGEDILLRQRSVTFGKEKKEKKKKAGQMTLK